MAISVVTGAAGFVGRALVRRLLADGDEVRAVVLPRDPAIPELRALEGADRLAIVEGDVTDAASLDPAFAGATRAFHAAALVHAWAPLARFRAVNVGGTENVARACRAHGVRLVAISTSDVFGIPDTAGERMDEASPVRPWNEPYADTKIEAERWLWAFRREHGLALSIIYPGWVYGPGDTAFFPSLARAIDDGFMVFWARDVVLAWVYVENLVDACVLASTHPDAIGEGYLVHDDAAGPTFEEACARIARAIGKTPPSVHVPYPVAFAAATALQTVWRWLGIRSTPPLLTVDVKAFGHRWHLSSAKIRRDLGWSPRVDTETGMQRALGHLVELRSTGKAHRD
jgi:nucleoside-diphosphate-sugar epimerase